MPSGAVTVSALSSFDAQLMNKKINAREQSDIEHFAKEDTLE